MVFIAKRYLAVLLCQLCLRIGLAEPPLVPFIETIIVLLLILLPGWLIQPSV
jgi:hypothetical protein